MTQSPPSTPPPPAAPPPPARRGSERPAIEPAVRFVGYVSILMFLGDLAQILAGYFSRPLLDAQSDAGLASQVLERIWVPLVGFALVFGWEVHNLSRFERIWRKLLSYGTLIGLLGCLGCGVLSVSSSMRIRTRSVAIVDFTTTQRTSAIATLRDQVGNLSGNGLTLAYNSVVRPPAGAPVPDAAAMRAQITAAIPGAIAAEQTRANQTKSQGRRAQILVVGKYVFYALLGAAAFFALWEASTPARFFKILKQRDAPGLALEGAVIGGFGAIGRKMEGIRILPDMESYSWYRRLRRKLRRRKG